MIYPLNSPNLGHAIDMYKTGHYGEDDYDDDEPMTCPVCDEQTYELYKNTHTNEIVGCNHCIELKYSHEIT